MKVNMNGSLELEAGEIMPFVCPKCQWFIEYDDKLLMVNCFKCKYIGERSEFEQEFSGEEVKENYDK